MLRTRRTPAHHDHPQPRELLGPRVLRGVQLPPAEALLAWVPGPERPVPGAGGIDQRPGRPVPGRGLDEQPPAVPLAHGPHVHRPQHPQIEGALVILEVLGDHLGGRPRRIGPGQLHPGQRVHPVHLAVRQRGPPELPGTARAGGVVQDDEVTARLESAAPQVIGAGQPCLPGAYDDCLGIVHASTNFTGAGDLPGPPPGLRRGAGGARPAARRTGVR